MSKAKTNMIIKRIVDTAMTVLLLSLMAYQVTGEMAHEWIGMGMTVLVIIHQILNRKWYGALICRKIIVLMGSPNRNGPTGILADGFNA